MRSLSILIPALNEEAFIAQTVNDLLPIARNGLDTFEIIVVDDGSTDHTGAIADTLAQENAEVRVIHHPERRGLAAGFRTGIAAAQKEFFVLVPGDNAYQVESLRVLFEAVGQADLIIGCRTNQQHSRRPLRVMISRVFNTLFGLLFGHPIKDVHGMPIYRLSLLREMHLKAQNYSFQLESMACMLRCSEHYLEIPVILNPDLKGNSRALRVKTFLDIAQTFWRLIFNRSQGC